MEASGSMNGDLRAIDGTTVPVAFDPNESGYVTLTSGDTYYFIAGGTRGAPLASIQIVTDSAIAGTFTIETCNLPRIPEEAGSGARIADNDETSGNWVKEDPSTAYVASVGTGWTWTNLTGVKTAGVAGAMIHLGNLGAKRVRVAFVCTTSGKVRVNAAAKS